MKLIGSENFASASRWGRNNSAPRNFCISFLTVIILNGAATESLRGCVIRLCIEVNFCLRLVSHSSGESRKYRNLENSNILILTMWLVLNCWKNEIYRNILMTNHEAIKGSHNRTIWTSNTFYTNQHQQQFVPFWKIFTFTIDLTMLTDL